MKDSYTENLLAALQQLPTSQLDAMLQTELEKELPDAQTVRLILKVLREREADFPVVHTPQIDAAWKRYQKKTRSAGTDFRTPLIKTAAIAILFTLFLFALPQKASADNFFDRIAAWTENVFSLFSPDRQDNAQREYVFRTDHPGLQELYNTVTAQGVTVPVVPMWLDTAYVLGDCDVCTSPVTTKVQAVFFREQAETLFELNVYSGDIPREFQKADQQAEKCESNGIDHYIFENNGLWTIVWARDNLECTITIDCSKDDVYHIIDSIYTMEESY